MIVAVPSIAEYARARGFELLAWQAEAAKMVESGECAALRAGRGSGVTFFTQLVNDWKRENDG